MTIFDLRMLALGKPASWDVYLSSDAGEPTILNRVTVLARASNGVMYAVDGVPAGLTSENVLVLEHDGKDDEDA